MKAVVALVVLLVGCTPAAIQAGSTIARDLLLPAAASALRAAAEKRGVEIDESGAVCFEVPEVSIDVPEFDGLDLVALMCVAPSVGE